MPLNPAPINPQLIGYNVQELANQIPYGVNLHLKVPFTFATVDAGILWTVPALPSGVDGLRVEATFWEVSTSFTGGASSAIGASSSNVNFNTKGDLLGGAAGDAAAVVISTGTPYKGALGTKITAPLKAVLVAGDTVRFDRITSAFTAGAGFLHMDLRLVG